MRPEFCLTSITPGSSRNSLPWTPRKSSKVFKAFKKLKALTWNEVFQDHGLKWEELKSVPGKYTIRLSQSYRAVVVREGAFMRLQTLHRDHDEAYGRK